MPDRMVVLALLVAACDRGATGPDCNAAATSLIASIDRADIRSDLLPARPALVRRCTTDRWSDAARACMVKATTKEAAQDCLHHQLTGPQADQVKKAFMPVEMMKFSDETDRMCACKQATCAQSIADEMTRWTLDATPVIGADPPLTAEETKAIEKVGERMLRCMGAALVPAREDAM